MDHDIPVAERIKPTAITASASPARSRLWLGIVIACLGLGTGLAWFLPRFFSPSLPSSNPTSPASAAAPPPENLLGHLPYPEAPRSELQAITPDGSIQLRQAAAQEFIRMRKDAQAAGIQLVPISGFRSITDQDHLFFDIKQERGQVPTQRAQVSAPPGYSEHHTGYAIDIGDATAPATNLSPSFDQTEAFAWLEKNAAYYSFELSFPKNNPQGISYEPWHWRYVGNQDSLKTFYQARQMAQSPQPETSETQP